MSEPGPSGPTPRTRSGRGVRIALALSLAVNLAVVGVIGGAVLRRGGDRGDDGPPALHALGLGPFAFALPREGRDELRGRMGEVDARLRDERRAIGTALRAVQQALLAEPFDRAAADAALQASRQSAAALQTVGHEALLDQFETMTRAERAEVADRLDRVLHRLGGRRR